MSGSIEEMTAEQGMDFGEGIEEKGVIREAPVPAGYNGGQTDMIRDREPLILAAAAAIFVAAILAVALIPVLSRRLTLPCRVESDCRFQNVDMEDIIALGKREKDGMTGLLSVAAWRFGEAGDALEPVTGRHSTAGTVYVCGAMAAAFPAKVLSGSYEQVMGDRDCVVTKSLSYALFGATDTAGCRLTFDGKSYRIAAVIDRGESLLLLPRESGRAENAAFIFENRERLKEKVEALGFEVN